MRACFKLWSIVAVSLALLAGPLQAEFAYVVAGGVVFAYRVSDNGALTPSPVRLSRRVALVP
jgi:hypothetical protein